MTTEAAADKPDQRMKVEWGGKTYRILFEHWDNRFVRHTAEDGRVTKLGPQHPRRIKRDGLARTTCHIREVVGQEEGTGRDIYGAVLAEGQVRCSPKDQFNRAHGRWYALERALFSLRDDRLRRALRKAYYAGTTWRPDGRDGFKIVRKYHSQPPELVRVGR